jgi:hypothetical protein
MSRSSVLLKDFNYLVYDTGFHDRLYDPDEQAVAEIDGNDLFSCLEYFTDGEVVCIGIYEFGHVMFAELENHPVLADYISQDSTFSGAIMVPADGNKLTYSQIPNIVEAFKCLGHCKGIGNTYATKLDHIHDHTIYTMYDDVE